MSKNKQTRPTLSARRSEARGLALSGAKGFTLIELLIVGVLIVSITGILGGTLITSLRSGSKSKISNEVSQNGNFALTVISQDVVAASEVVSMNGNSGCIDTTPPDPHTSWGPSTEIVLKKDNGDQVTFACEDHVVGGVGIGSIKRKFHSADPLVPDKENWLLDSSQVAVEAGSCSFVCSQTSTDEGGTRVIDEYAVPVIDIAFILKQKGDSTSAEDTANSIFRTSSILRNFRAF